MDWMGIVSLFFGSGVLVTLGRFFWSYKKHNEEQIKALQLGVQALLRNKMVEIYNYSKEKGYAGMNTRNNFENIWQQYHSLGANGVMDDIHEKFLELPTEKED